MDAGGRAAGPSLVCALRTDGGQIEIPLPPEYRFHSVFSCPVSKEQASEVNPPMMLGCGHVIAKESLAKLSKGGQCAAYTVAESADQQQRVRQVRDCLSCQGAHDAQMPVLPADLDAQRRRAPVLLTAVFPCTPAAQREAGAVLAPPGDFPSSMRSDSSPASIAPAPASACAPEIRACVTMPASRRSIRAPRSASRRLVVAAARCSARQPCSWLSSVSTLSSRRSPRSRRAGRFTPCTTPSPTASVRDCPPCAWNAELCLTVQWDHVANPGPVPRSFVGPLWLAAASYLPVQGWEHIKTATGWSSWDALDTQIIGSRK